MSRQQHSQCCSQSQAALLPKHAGTNPQPQHAGCQDNGNGKRVLPQLNLLGRGLQPRRRSPCRRDSPAPLYRTSGDWLSFSWL